MLRQAMLRKRDLRRWARSLPPPSEAEAELVRAALADWLRQLPPGTRVLTFLAMPDEVDLEPLTVAFPHLHWLTTRTPEDGLLTVHRLDAPRERHPLGFMQPRAEVEVVDPGSVQVSLVPGLVFDRRGGRLGRGTGHYDRLLGRIPGTVEVVGVTLDRFVVEEVPVEPLDHPMDLLATESGVHPAVR